MNTMSRESAEARTEHGVSSLNSRPVSSPERAARVPPSEAELLETSSVTSPSVRLRCRAKMGIPGRTILIGEDDAKSDSSTSETRPEEEGRQLLSLRCWHTDIDRPLSGCAMSSSSSPLWSEADTSPSKPVLLQPERGRSLEVADPRLLGPKGDGIRNMSIGCTLDAAGDGGSVTGLLA